MGVNVCVYPQIMNEWDGDAADAPRDATHCNDGNVTTRRD